MHLFSDYSEIISRFQTNPANAVLYYIILAVAILLSLILHECGHALVAYWCGDPTAKMMGRLTLNPVKHLDPMGTVMMLLFRFGWAKPVPINPRNFRHYRRDYAFVSLAGITVNLLLFLVFMGLSVFLNQHIWNAEILGQLGMTAEEMHGLPFMAVSTGNFATTTYFSTPLMALSNGDPAIAAYIENVFSTIPSTVTGFMNAPALMYLQFFFQLMASVNLSLAFFNLLPIPPLDGFRVLDSTVFKGRLQITPQAYQIIRIVTLVLLFTGIISRVLGWIMEPIYTGVYKLFLHIGGIA